MKIIRIKTNLSHYYQTRILIIKRLILLHLLLINYLKIIKQQLIRFRSILI
nr:MAG TPA: hypothetical protein [Caudoviricetes sp.]